MSDDRNPSNRTTTIRPEHHRFLLDVMLGKLAVYLRMCGFDTAYISEDMIGNDNRIRTIAEKTDRILLSRDADLIAGAEDGILLTAHSIRGQLAELVSTGVVLSISETPTYCGRCNNPLERVPDGVVRPDYAPDPDEFDCWRCPACDQFFWTGSHWESVRKVVDSVTESG